MKLVNRIITVIMIMMVIFSFNTTAFAADDQKECKYYEGMLTKSVAQLKEDGLSYEQISLNSNNEQLDGGITGSDFEEQFDDVVDYIYKLREEGRSFDEINIMIESEPMFSGNAHSTIGIRKAKGLDPSDKFYDYAHLNDIEKKLFESNKAKALLCLANGKLALEYSQDLYKNEVLHNGNGDAFRHTLWNFGMAIDVGQDFAKKWADAHENGASGQPALEKEMDLFNNKVGRELAKSYPNTTLHSTFKKKSRQKVRDGKCKIISNNKLVKSSNYGEK